MERSHECLVLTWARSGFAFQAFVPTQGISGGELMRKTNQRQLFDVCFARTLDCL